MAEGRGLLAEDMMNRGREPHSAGAGRRPDEDGERQERRRETDQALRSERSAGARASHHEEVERDERSTTDALVREREHEDELLRRERDFAEERSRLLAAAEEARARAEAATRMRDEFLGIVSHDLKNPLGAILMHSALVLAKAPADTGLRAHRALESIHRSAARALRIVDDLLDVAAIDAGRLAMKLEPVTAADLIAEAVEPSRPHALERSLGLEFRIDVGVGQEVLCDAGRILQVLANLIGNAIKFTPHGGTIRVAAEAAVGAVRFAVSDTGPGIPSEHRERVFERFWQATPGEHGGKGLGLYIAKSIVEAHGGRIWFEPRPGGGGTFSFEIPFAGVRAGRKAA